MSDPGDLYNVPTCTRCHSAPQRHDSNFCEECFRAACPNCTESRPATHHSGYCDKCRYADPELCPECGQDKDPSDDSCGGILCDAAVIRDLGQRLLTR